VQASPVPASVNSPDEGAGGIRTGSGVSITGHVFSSSTDFIRYFKGEDRIFKSFQGKELVMKKHVIGMLGFFMVILLCTAGSLAAQGAGKVDINEGDAAALQELPGIGPAMALRIIEYREANGPFKRIEDLMEVKGIGEKRFLNLKDMITVGTAAPAESGAGNSTPSGETGA